MTIGKLATISAALAFASLACGARTLIGMVPDGSAPDDTGPGAVDAGPDGSIDLGGANSGGTCTPVPPGDQPFTTPPSLAGVWTGYVQGGVGLNSDAIKLTLDQKADGSSQIHVVFGTATPPPPATSATELYPPGWAYMQVTLMSLFEGYSYEGHNVKWQAFGQQWRLTFGIVAYGGWDSWCRLQTSYPVNQQGDYSCMPSTAFTYKYAGEPNEECFALNAGGYAQDAGGSTLQVPCAEAHLCDTRHCTCDACGCAQSSNVDFSFDLLFDADTASGSAVHLIRAAN